MFMRFLVKRIWKTSSHVAHALIPGPTFRILFVQAWQPFETLHRPVKPMDSKLSKPCPTHCLKPVFKPSQTHGIKLFKPFSPTALNFSSLIKFKSSQLHDFQTFQAFQLCSNPFKPFKSLSNLFELRTSVWGFLQGS